MSYVKPPDYEVRIEEGPMSVEIHQEDGVIYLSLRDALRLSIELQRIVQDRRELYESY